MKSAARPARKKSAKTAPSPKKSTKSPRSDYAGLYEQVKPLLLQYAPPFAVNEKKNVSGKIQLDLSLKKDVVFNGRKVDTLYFAGLIPQKDFLGLYLMAPYMFPDLKKKLRPAIAKMLRGKSCFHIKSGEKQVIDDIRDTLRLSYVEFKKSRLL
jgi:hypothetical protein